MAIWLKEATASQEVPLGFFLDSADGDAEETGLTIANTDIKLWKTGATTLANKNSGGATHISNGIYYITLDATDTNTLGPMVIFVHVAGALSIKEHCLVVPANVWDSLFSTDKLQVDTTQIEGGDATDAITTAAAAALTSYDPPTNAELVSEINAVQTDIAALNNLSAAQVNAEVDTALADYDAPTKAELDAGFAALNDPTAAAVADAVWDEALSGHAVSGSAGEALEAAGTAGDPWTTALPGAYGAGTAGQIVGDNLNATVGSRASQSSLDTVDGNVDSILADTNELQGDWANGGRLDLILDARASQASVDDLPTNSELATALAGADDAVLAAIAALNNLSAAQVNAEVVDALNVDTYAEPTGTPPAAASVAQKIGTLYMAFRNEVTVTSSAKTFYDDSGNAEFSKSLTDDGTTYTEAEAS